MSTFRIFIPTRDSAKWVGAFLEAYRRLGIEPLYVVDSRSKDGTLEALRSLGAETVSFTPSDDFAEAGMTEFGADCAGTKWVMRIDDDEFPSRALIEWAQTGVIGSLNQSWLISRRELFARDERVFYSRSRGRFTNPFRADFLHPQERLYHVDRVSYVHRVHTSGLAPNLLFDFAPANAFMIHCNCLLRSPAERLAKVRRYEEIEHLSCWRVGDEYLPELFSLEHHAAASDGLDEFSDLIAALPIQREENAPEVTDDEFSLMSREVVRYAEEIELQRRRLGYNHVSVDAIRWITHVPRTLRRSLAEFLCTFGRGRLRGAGVMIWNYYKLTS